MEGEVFIPRPAKSFHSWVLIWECLNISMYPKRFRQILLRIRYLHSVYIQIRDKQRNPTSNNDRKNGSLTPLHRRARQISQTICLHTCLKSLSSSQVGVYTLGKEADVTAHQPVVSVFFCVLGKTGASNPPKFPCYSVLRLRLVRLSLEQCYVLLLVCNVVLYVCVCIIWVASCQFNATTLLTLIVSN